jgi:hypothetical protein
LAEFNEFWRKGMNLNRRGFIRLGIFAPLLVNGLLWPQPLWVSTRKKGIVVMPGLLNGRTWLYDWDRGSITSVSCSPLVHSALKNPRAPNEIFLLEKGPGSAVLDMQSKSLKRRVKLERGSRFYGHGTFSHDGKSLLTTEAFRSKEGLEVGRIAVRNPKTLDLVREIPTFGSIPHDICLIDPDTIAVGHVHWLVEI